MNEQKKASRSPVSPLKLDHQVDDEDLGECLLIESTPQSWRPILGSFGFGFGLEKLKSIPEDLIVLYFNDERDRAFRKYTLLYVSVLAPSKQEN
jgi:hypothetical protein